jgi:hypothetical protein
MLSGKPGEMLEAALGNFKRSRIATVVAKSHVIVGTFARDQGGGQRPEPGWQDHHHLGGGRRAHGLLQANARSTWWSTCRPSCLTAVVGTNTIEAMILAALEQTARRSVGRRLR